MAFSGFEAKRTENLMPGQTIATRFGRELRIVRKLGSGGQGAVYEVSYDGRPMALKWYTTGRFLNRDRFINNLIRNITAGPPTNQFLWPLDITQDTGGHFGYVMELAPKDLVEADDLLLNPGLVTSYKRLVDACMGIAQAFRILHNKGYRYQDLSAGNFFVDPQTGKVLICDNDNVAPDGMDLGIRGTTRFMAPEIVRGDSMPSMRSDLHSLAVLVFLLLLFQHPLEGMRMGAMDSANVESLYGTNPLFIFDESDQSNRPIHTAQSNALKVWPYMPAHMQQLFRRAFSQDALMNPNRRISEREWTVELAHFRSEIVCCPCGNEVFLDGAEPRHCECCDALVSPRLCFKLPRITLPLVKDTRIYACQLGVAVDADQALDPLVWVLTNKRNPETFALYNMSQHPWTITKGARTVEVAPGKLVRALPGMTLHIDGTDVEIESVHS